MSQLHTLTIDEIQEEFAFLGDWDDQCDYLIDLGFDLPEMPAAHKRDENLVRGCQSRVWMVAAVNRQTDPPIIEILADSDAYFVRGLIAVLLSLFSGRTPQEVLSTDAGSIFRKLGLERHLSSVRKNGLVGMVRRIREIAAHAV